MPIVGADNNTGAIISCASSMVLCIRGYAYLGKHLRVALCLICGSPVHVHAIPETARPDRGGELLSGGYYYDDGEVQHAVCGSCRYSMGCVLLQQVPSCHP